MTIDQAAAITDEIFRLYEQKGGQEYAGGKTTWFEHMIGAARLAEKDGYPEEVILAVFLHGIGHICVPAGQTGDAEGTPDMNQEEIGADFLAGKGFSRKIVRLVESQAEARRYLIFKDPRYYIRLSESDKKILEYRGGPMIEEEAAAFEQYPLFDLIMRMRKWDELAGTGEEPMPDLLPYRQMMTRHLGSVLKGQPVQQKNS